MNTPSKVEISRRFSDGDYLRRNRDWHAADSRWKARQIERILKKNKLNFQTIGEVGCGAGEVLLELSARYPYADMTGFELSPDAFAICSNKANEKVSFEFTDIATVDRVFDVLLCIDVFEHVENYIEFLRSLRANAKFHVFHVPLDISASSVLRGKFTEVRRLVGHLHYFTRETALATLVDAGYDILDNFYTAPFLADGPPISSSRARLAKLPRRLVYALSPTLLSRAIGGCSLLVLAKG